MSKGKNWIPIVNEVVNKLDMSQIANLASIIIQSKAELDKLKLEYEFKANELAVNNSTKLHELKLEYDSKQNDLKEKGNIFIQLIKQHEDSYRFHIQKQYDIAIESIQAIKFYLQLPDTSNEDKKFALQLLIESNSKILSNLKEQSLETSKALPNQPPL